MINREDNKNDDLEIDFLGNRIGSKQVKQSSKKATTKNKILMVVWILIASVMIYQIIMLGLYTMGKVSKGSAWLYTGVDNVVRFFIGNSGKETVEEYNVKIAGLGDIYFTSNTLNGAKMSNEYDFTIGNSAVKNLLKGYDFVLASLNTPIANKTLGYSQKAVYNAPESVIDMLKDLNVKNIATATSHILDKNVDGLKSTISALKEASINQIGISNNERNKPVIMTKDGLKIGLLSYATKSNVKYKEEEILNVLNDEDLKKDIEYLKEQKVDFIISYLNVPDENANLVNATQKKSVETLFNAGVNVVLGTGSMVIQESDEDEIKIGEEKSHIYTIYSLGDFMGSYATQDNRNSVIANLEFSKKVTKNSKGEIVKEEKDMKVKEPIGIYTMIDKNYKKQMYIINDEIASYDKGNSEITSKTYQSMKSFQTKMQEIYN